MGAPPQNESEDYVTKGILAIRLGSNQDDITVLEKKLNPLIRAVCSRILKDDNDIDDAVQMTWMNAIKNIDAYRGESKFETWISKIAHNAAYDIKRSQQRRPAVTRPDFEISSGGHNLSPPDAAIYKEEQDIIARILSAVKKVNETAFSTWEKAHNGVKYEIIAQEQDIPVGTVKTRVHRIKKMIELEARKKGINLIDSSPSPEI